MLKNLVVMAANVNKNLKVELSSLVEALSRLIDSGFPSALPAGFSLSLVYAYEELKDAESYLKDVEL